jgi:hypothetical protein
MIGGLKEISVSMLRINDLKLCFTFISSLISSYFSMTIASFERDLKNKESTICLTMNEYKDYLSFTFLVALQSLIKSFKVLSLGKLQALI